MQILLGVSLALLGTASAVELQHAEIAQAAQFEALIQRAAADAPDSYSPTEVDCPSKRPEVRIGSSLSPQEQEWLPRRRSETIPNIKDFLKRAPITGFDSDKYFSGVKADSASLPNIGIAVSGGGYRAMLNGAGAIAAFDSRSPGSTDKGNMGGLLQSATYISGLSGGGWLVGSIYANNFTTVHDAVNSGDIWQFGNSILEGPKKMGIIDYFSTILGEVDRKHDAGFNRTITDYWGRMLSFQLVKAKHGGPGVTFSSIADDPAFSQAKTPLPFLVADSRAPNEKNTSILSTLYDISPWELGSSDASLNGFIPLKYAGSPFVDGKIADTEKCVRGFDNIGYVMGTSSSLFNQIVLRIQNNTDKYVPKDVPKAVVKGLIEVLNGLGKRNGDIANWTPNPFKGWNREKNNAATSDHLALVDGGEDGQNVPFHPHTVIDRKVDVIFAVDSSADVKNWPVGAAPMATYQRSISPVANGTSFPVVPGRNSFINLGLNTKPTFFGCNSKNTTQPAPLVVYLANYPYIFHSNTSTFEMTYNNSVRDAMISNGWAVVTQANSTRDPDWPACVSCAMLHRSFERTSTAIPAKCTQCFDRYCWNGTIDESEPAKTYEPQMIGDLVKIKQKNSGSHIANSFSTILVSVSVVGLMLAL